LSQKLEHAEQRMQTGLDQLRAGNLSGMETSIRDIQREVASVATTVVQIQAAMKNGARATASTPAMPAPQAPPPAAAAAAESAPRATPAPAPAPAGTDTAPTGQPAATNDAGGYQTGKRNTTGKNVLGAIAKLKQMKN